MGIGELLGSSFNYAKDALVGKWVRWIVLLICTIIQGITFCIIPLVNGYIVRVFEGADTAPEVDRWGKLFVDGWKLNIIGIVYFLIPLIIALIVLALTAGFGELTLLFENIANPGALLGMFMGSLAVTAIVFIIFAIIFGLFGVIGMVKFARSGKMGDAFHFSEIIAQIGKIGWGKYIVALIVFFIIIFIIVIILSLIPIIGWIILFIIEPLLAIWQGRFYSKLYDAGV